MLSTPSFYWWSVSDTDRCGEFYFSTFMRTWSIVTETYSGWFRVVLNLFIPPDCPHEHTWICRSVYSSWRFGKVWSPYGLENNIWKNKMFRKCGLAFASALRRTHWEGKRIQTCSTPFFSSFFSFYGNMCLGRETASLWGGPHLSYWQKWQ